MKSLLNTPDNSTELRGNFASFNYPSPYQFPQYNYGTGPQFENKLRQLESTDGSVFKNTPALREPTKNNPFMNVNPVDYDTTPLFDDYYRYKQSNGQNKSEEIASAVETNFENNLFKDAESLMWNRVNSQRQFVSMPVGSVPSNQGEFANWLWGTKNNCKAGSIYANYGIQYNDDSLLCTGYSLPIMTNKGTL